MLRLSAPGYLRLRQSMPGALETAFAGAEVNAAVAIASLGGVAEFVTALPTGDITEACLASVRAMNVGVQGVALRDEGRFGIYFVESGAGQRGGRVLYDRDGTTFARTPAAHYDWPRLLAGVDWFHTTGISASVSRVAAEATLDALQAAKVHGLTVSLDINHRRQLWRWDETLAPEVLARRTLQAMLPLVDVLIGNPSDLALVAGLEGIPGSADRSLAVDAAREVARATVRRFPHLLRVAVTLRENPSASHNNWGALLHEPARDGWAIAPQSGDTYVPYEIPLMVDRVGTGDVFAGALIHALQTPKLSAGGEALRFAVAASCLAHSVKGDFSYCTRAEVEALLAGNSGGAMAR